MKKINFTHNIETKELEIIWENEQKKININKDEDVDLNNLYDFIINNIDEVDIEFHCKNDDYDVASKASKIIFDKIESELKEIKKQRNNFKIDEEIGSTLS